MQINNCDIYKFEHWIVCKMWKLKRADGGNDPYIFSTNNFVGRQIWEFHPTGGTPEEWEEVEAARLNFFNSCHQVKPSSDLLWRMQVLFFFFFFFFFFFKKEILTLVWERRGTIVDSRRGKLIIAYLCLFFLFFFCF